MISFTADHVRLSVDKDEPFDAVTESVRTVFQICRVNNFDAALIVSKQDPLDWRSSMRVAIRFSASRWQMPSVRLALVVTGARLQTRGEVEEVAQQAGMTCSVFEDEEEALRWIAAVGSAPA